VLCDVIEDWLEAHKDLRRNKAQIEGVATPKAARHEYLCAACLYGGQHNGKAIYDFFECVRDPDWPQRAADALPTRRRAPPATRSTRVCASRFDLLREGSSSSIHVRAACTPIRTAPTPSRPSRSWRSGSPTRRAGGAPRSEIASAQGNRPP
jgi:hypothetical protein